MTEPKRATWREFATFMASRCSWPTTEGAAMWRAVPPLRSKRDAQIAYAAAYGYGDEDFERDVAAWFDALRVQGVEPPADPPSVAEVLKRLSYQFDACESDAASASSSLAWKTAAKMTRGKAKEFT